jgi:Kef-type K+ transport system membrane component KefB
MSVYQSISLFLVVLATFIAPFISKTLKLPVVTAEILVGMLLGPTVLNVVEISSFLHFLAEFGFLLLMFYVGLEIEIKHINLKLILLNILAFILNITLSIAIIKIFSLNIIWVTLFAGVSVGIVVGVLKELKILNERIGKITLYSGIIQEFIILLIATSYEILKIENYSIIKYIEIIISIILSVIFFKTVKLLHWWYPEYFQYFAHSKDPLSIRIRFALTVMLLSVSFAFYFHIDPVVGAFIAGFVISLSFIDTTTIKQDIETIGLGFFIPLFFVYTGINTKVLLSDIPFAALIVLLMFASHIGNIIVFYFNGYSLGKSTILSLNLTKGVSIVVLLMTIGKNEHLITQEIFSIAILIGIISEIFYTVLFKIGYKLWLKKHKEAEGIPPA